MMMKCSLTLVHIMENNHTIHGGGETSSKKFMLLNLTWRIFLIFGRLEEYMSVGLERSITGVRFGSASDENDSTTD